MICGDYSDLNRIHLYCQKSWILLVIELLFSMQPPILDLKFTPKMLDTTGVEKEGNRMSNMMKPSHPPPCKPPGSGPVGGGLFRRRQYRRQGSKENVIPEAGAHQEQRVTDDQQDAVTEEFYQLAHEQFSEENIKTECKMDGHINPINSKEREDSAQSNLQEETWLDKLQLDQEALLQPNADLDVMSKGAKNDVGCVFYQRENPLNDQQEDAYTQEYQQYLEQEAEYYQQLQKYPENHEQLDAGYYLQQNNGDQIQFTEGYQLPKVKTKKDTNLFLPQKNTEDEFHQLLNEEQHEDEYYRRQIIDEENKKYAGYYQRKKQEDAEYYLQQNMTLFAESQQNKSGSFLKPNRQQLRRQQLRDAEFHRQCISINQQKSIQEESQRKNRHDNRNQRQKMLQRHESSTSSSTSTEGSQHAKSLSSSGSSHYQKESGINYVAKTARQVNESEISANASSHLKIYGCSTAVKPVKQSMPPIRQVLPRTKKRRGMVLS